MADVDAYAYCLAEGKCDDNFQRFIISLKKCLKKYIKNSNPFF